MKSTATTAAAYLESLPPDRRGPIETVRRFILDHLDKDLQECMQYGVVGYCVPHRVWPHGHHTNPKLPLMYMGLSSQKNDMVVYMLFLHHDKPEREWFDTAWKAAGRKSFLDVSGAGCCLRFKKVDDLALDVIGKAMRRVPVRKYLDSQMAMLTRLGKAPDGKALKTTASGGKASAGAKAKSTRSSPKGRTSKKKPAAKRA